MSPDEKIFLEVKVHPGSKKQSIELLSPNTLRLKLTSRPIRGAANQEAIQLLSKFLKIPKSKIKLVKGERSKGKVFLLKGISGEYITEKLNTLNN